MKVVYTAACCVLVLMTTVYSFSLNSHVKIRKIMIDVASISCAFFLSPSISSLLSDPLLHGTLSLPIQGVQPVRATDNIQFRHDDDDSKYIAFSYPASLSLKVSNKPLQTHTYEVLLKSENIRGLNIGVTVDPVRINTITSIYPSPQQLGNQVVGIERNKEGVRSADLLASSIAAQGASSAGDLYPSYDVEYVVDSTRGQNHYLTKTTIIDKQLYVMTAQTKEVNWKELKPTLVEVLDSLTLK